MRITNTTEFSKAVKLNALNLTEKIITTKLLSKNYVLHPWLVSCCP